mgnify:CR=1 FL=1
MQKRNYLELPKENGPRFYYRSEPLQKSSFAKYKSRGGFLDFITALLS